MIIPGIAGRLLADPQTQPGVDRQGTATAAQVGEWPSFAAPGIEVAAVSGWTAQVGDICCAIAGNVDWLNVEFADLQLKRDPAQALLQAYRQHGRELLSRVGGRFALCIWDAGTRSALIACDRFGQIPVYWALARDGSLLFGPTATAVNGLNSDTPVLSEQDLFNYLYFHMVPGPGTIFRGVSKLMPAHVLVGTDGDWQAHRYWEPDFREHADVSLAEAAGEMLGLLYSSVSRLAGDVDTGAFLSGGLDSSTVAGLLARHRPQPKTYSIGFNADGYDEIAYARLASTRFQTDFQTYYVTPEDVVTELPRIAGAYDEPFGNSSALPAYFCARMAADDGRRRLLAGDGGDEVFGGNERYAKQMVFERYGRLPPLARRAMLEPMLLRLLPEAWRLTRKGRSYVRQARIPLPDRLQTYNFMNHLGFEQIVSADLLHAVDPQLPLQLDRDLYKQPRSASILNRMLYLDWHHTLADNDLRKVNRMCQLAGVEVEYPMLDDRLVEFSTRVSSSRKMRGNRLRDFYKRAVKDFLPREIITKRKHGFGLPFGVWMEEHPGLQALAGDNLSRMRRRRFIQPAFFDEITRLHREQHAGYYGEFLWVLLMLELWLTAQGFEP